MALDTFVLEFLFNDKKTAQSAQKIEAVVDKLTKGILKSFAAVASFDFLAKAVTTTVALATQLDNLSYMTNVSKEDLNAWGEAVKRNGGTVNGFYNSINSLSAKIREMQTSFGSTAGQGVFARLGINLQDSNGRMKTAVQLLAEIGDKFRTMPKAWQLRLGEQLGLDPATIRLISTGSKETLGLVERMRVLGNIQEINSEKSIKLRNAMYDLSLIWQNIKITIGNALIPLLTRFSDLLLKSFDYLQRHGEFVKIVLTGISTILGVYLIKTIYAVASAIMTRLIPALKGIFIAAPELLVLIGGIVALGLAVDDFATYMRGGNAEFSAFYDWVKKTLPLAEKFLKIITLPARAVFSFFKDISLDDTDDSSKNSSSPEKNVEGKKKLQDFIKKSILSRSIEAGVDPELALTVAQLENSQLDPKLKSKAEGSTASGIFQINNITLKDSLKTLREIDKLKIKDKNDPLSNIILGVNNLKNVSDRLKNLLGRSPTNPEVYLGEIVGASGANKVLKANRNTMLSSILDPSAISQNNSKGFNFANMTAGQLINQTQAGYAHQSSLNINHLNIHTQSKNPEQMAKMAGPLLHQEFSKLVHNSDNGVAQ